MIDKYDIPTFPILIYFRIDNFSLMLEANFLPELMIFSLSVDFIKPC